MPRTTVLKKRTAFDFDAGISCSAEAILPAASGSRTREIRRTYMKLHLERVIYKFASEYDDGVPNAVLYHHRVHLSMKIVYLPFTDGCTLEEIKSLSAKVRFEPLRHRNVDCQDKLRETANTQVIHSFLATSSAASADRNCQDR
jgi:hypothetical protein